MRLTLMWAEKSKGFKILYQKSFSKFKDNALRNDNNKKECE